MSDQTHASEQGAVELLRKVQSFFDSQRFNGALMQDVNSFLSQRPTPATVSEHTEAKGSIGEMCNAKWKFSHASEQGAVELLRVFASESDLSKIPQAEFSEAVTKARNLIGAPHASGWQKKPEASGVYPMPHRKLAHASEGFSERKIQVMDACMCTEEMCCFPSFASFLDYECQGSDSCCDYWPDYKPKSHRYK